MSEKGDLLSQWRGYANDGAGFAIGFNADALSFLPRFEGEPGGLSPYLDNPKLHQVAYAKKAQRETLRPWFESMQQMLKDAHSIKTLKAISASDQLDMARAAQAMVSSQIRFGRNGITFSESNTQLFPKSESGA